MRDRFDSLRQRYWRRAALPGWILTFGLPCWKALDWLDQLDTGRRVLGEVAGLYSWAVATLPADMWLALLFVAGFVWLALIGFRQPIPEDKGSLGREARETSAPARGVSTIKPAVTNWAGVPWRIRNRQAYPHCPDHPDVPLMFDYNGDRRDHIPHPSFPSSMRGRMFCTEGDEGHHVRFNDKGEITAAELQNEQKVADQRLTIEFKRLNPT